MVAGDRDSTARLITDRAQHAGRGVLDDLLSVETKPGADGLFHLAGLTPGHYRIQASLDGIWLSGSAAVTVGTWRAVGTLCVSARWNV